MSAFDDIFEGALDVLSDHHGSALSYVDDEEETVTFTAIGVTPEYTEEINDDTGRAERIVRDVAVFKSDFEATVNAELTCGGADYAVERITADDGTMQAFRMVRKTRTEVSKPGWRRTK